MDALLILIDKAAPTFTEIVVVEIQLLFAPVTVYVELVAGVTVNVLPVLPPGFQV